MSKETNSLGFYERRGDFELGRGNVISTGDLSSWPGNYPVYSSSAVGEGIFGRYGRHMFDEELITWSIDGGGRPFHRRKHRYSVTNVCGYLRINRPDRWDYGYLHAVLEKLQSGIQFDYQMKAHPSVIRDLYRLECIPISEQRHIASVRDTLDTTIRQTEAIIDKLKQVKQGLLHDLLTRGIDANGELRPPQSEAPELYKESALGWIPREWVPSSVASEFSVDSGFTISPSRLPKNRRRKYLRVANVQRALLDLEHVSELEATDEEMASRCLLPGDLLIVEGHASTEEIGRCAMATEDVSGFTFQNHLFRLRALRLHPGFSLYWMNSNGVRAFWRNEAATSSGLNTINRSKLDRVLVAVPSEKEQLRIVKAGEAINHRITEESNQLIKLHAQKSGLMDDLLTGRVRVTPLLNTPD